MLEGKGDRARAPPDSDLPADGSVNKKTGGINGGLHLLCTGVFRAKAALVIVISYHH